MYIIENEKLMAEWDWEKNNELGLNPEKLTHGSNKKAWWKCDKGHSWQKSIEKRNNTNISCPYCNNKKTLLGYNDLNTLFPHIAIEWDFEKNEEYDIKTINITSISRIWWKCSVCGNEWQTRLRDRTGNGTGCPKCALKIRARKRIDT